MTWNWFLPARRWKTGLGRRGLRLAGPTWAASPLRRTVQTICLLAFFWLLMYVCWPYTARPARTWPGWIPVEVDAASGAARLSAESAPANPPAAGRRLFVVDAATTPPVELGWFTVRRAADDEIDLVLDDEPSQRNLDLLATSFGPWTLAERPPGQWPSHYADDLAAKETLPADSFLRLDPLVAVSSALAGRVYVGALAWAAAVLAIGLIVPRGFCGYVCPLGTLLDLFDRLLGRRLRRFHVAARGWWRNLRYYLLGAILAAALGGVLLSGFLAAIPLATRGLVFLLSPLQLAAARDWRQVPPLGSAQWLGILALLGVVALGALGPRFWCRHVCPTGAIFSAASALRLTQRSVDARCIECGRCREVCAFDAMEDDFSTRPADCAFCQTCGGACPTGAIRFGLRFPPTPSARAGAGDPPGEDSASGGATTDRRGLLRWAARAAAVVAGGWGAGGIVRASSGGLGRDKPAIVRPPGSLPEGEFLARCVRCGECIQSCPNNVLQPVGLDEGLELLWTPRVAADWSGCEASCANCGQVCPTGAIRPLPLDEKRFARMGLAVVNPRSCLPHAGREACQLCVDECKAAGYDAIEFLRVGAQMDPLGDPATDSGWLAPVVLAEKCVGCGLCQARCRHVNVKAKRLLGESAIQVVAGDGNEDRLRTGSYRALRERERQEREQRLRQSLGPDAAEGGYLPDFLNDE